MKLHQKLKALIEELKALGAKSEWSAEDETEEARIKADIAETKAAIAREQKRAGVKNEIAELDEYLNEPATSLPQAGEGDAPAGKAGEAARIDVISHVRKNSLKAFKGEKAAENAYGFGQFLLAALAGNAKAAQYCKSNGIQIKKHTEGVNADGGILVPVQYDNEIIDLREEYGVVRKYAKVKNMTSDTLNVKRREGGLTAYPIGEGAKITGSKKAWGDVNLTARKWGVLARMTNELNEDSIINLADDFAQEMAYAFAQKEDDCFFNGDGTGAYHGIVGVSEKLKGLNGTIANIAGLQVASGNTYAEVTAGDFTSLLAKAPSYLLKRNPRFFCSSAFYFNVIERLIDAAGGIAREEIVNGKPVYRYKGYPVEIVEVMPSIEANSQVACLFGDPALAAIFGDRRQTTIMRSDQGVVDGESLFEQDEQAIRATERFDINVHDVGNASATAANRKAGPMLGLVTAAS